MLAIETQQEKPAVYDMYPWHADGGRHHRAGDDRASDDRAKRAVQAALDRRDNGGDASAAPDGTAPAKPRPRQRRPH